MAVQRGRLPRSGAALAAAARLRLTPDEAALEARVTALRHRLAADTRELRIVDYGAGTRGLVTTEARPPVRRVAEVYRRAAATPGWGRFLFLLTRALKPLRVLELGTNLGVSAAHVALALEPGARLVSIEGDPGLAALARGHLAEAGVAERVEVVEGRFADRLPDVLDAHGPFDLVFIDGHHEAEATRRYWEMIAPHLAGGACVLFDDVEPGRPVRRAWRAIAEAATVAGVEAADLLGLGVLTLPAAPPISRLPGARDPFRASESLPAERSPAAAVQ